MQALDLLHFGRADGVQITTIRQSGPDLVIQGRAQSNARVSAYMRNLETSGWMTKPELSIIEAKPEEVKTLTNTGAGSALPYVFTLQVRLANPTAEQEAESAAAGPLATLGVILGILAVSFNLIYGITGQLTLFHAAAFGVGAYATHLSMAHWSISFWLGTAFALGCVAVVCNHALWDAELVAMAHAHGWRALSYTVNDEWAAQRLWALGTDGIITDRVDLFAPD